MNKKSCRALVAALLCAAAPVLADDLEKGKEIIAGSGLNVIAGDNLADAAQKIVKAVKG